MRDLVSQSIDLQGEILFYSDFTQTTTINVPDIRMDLYLGFDFLNTNHFLRTSSTSVYQIMLSSPTNYGGVPPSTPLTHIHDVPTLHKASHWETSASITRRAPFPQPKVLEKRIRQVPFTAAVSPLSQCLPHCLLLLNPPIPSFHLPISFFITSFLSTCNYLSPSLLSHTFHFC